MSIKAAFKDGLVKVVFQEAPQASKHVLFHGSTTSSVQAQAARRTIDNRGRFYADASLTTAGKYGSEKIWSVVGRGLPYKQVPEGKVTILGVSSNGKMLRNDPQDPNLHDYSYFPKERVDPIFIHSMTEFHPDLTPSQIQELCEKMEKEGGMGTCYKVYHFFKRRCLDGVGSES